jgi:hypothetical protein
MDVAPWGHHGHGHQCSTHAIDGAYILQQLLCGLQLRMPHSRACTRQYSLAGTALRGSLPLFKHAHHIVWWWQVEQPLLFQGHINIRCWC